MSGRLRFLFGKGFGFLGADELPDVSFCSADIGGTDGVEWVCTDDIAGAGVRNHCGAAAAANLAMYFISGGCPGLDSGGKLATFKAVHGIVGNGPRMTIAGGARKYFKSRGYALKHKTYLGGRLSRRLDAAMSAIDRGRPCALLLADGVFSWHWVLAVGYMSYPGSGETYLRIVDGWSGNASRYYKPRSGSLWVSATEYWI